MSRLGPVMRHEIGEWLPLSHIVVSYFLPRPEDSSARTRPPACEGWRISTDSAFIRESDRYMISLLWATSEDVSPEHL